MATRAFWFDDEHESWEPTSFDGRADVAVVGGGVTGCSCALTLAERGIRVRLHEAREIAGGASGRNGGFALRGATPPYDVARATLGRPAARLLMKLTERTLGRLEQLAGDAFRRVGSLRLAADDAERDALRREHDALREDGFAVEWIDELPPRLAVLYRGAILHPPDGAIRPARWVRRLAGHAARAGADVREHDTVSVDGVDADVVVVAADGYTASLLPELAHVVQPTRGQVLATEPLRERLFDRPHYARGGYDYWQQLPDCRLLLGGNRDAALAAEATPDEEVTDLVQRRNEELVERLVGYRPAITHRWAGIWGTTPDLQPLVGRAPGRDDVWIAAGYSGHGNVLGLACGDLVARAILGEQPPELELFAPSRFAAVR